MGDLRLTVTFATGEESRVIQGYSADTPVITAQKGIVVSTSFDSMTHRFRFRLSPSADGSAMVQITAE
jgi:hypothetical protein